MNDDSTPLSSEDEAMLADPRTESGGATLPPPPTDSSDRSLLQHYRQGDQDAARQLYQRYADRLLRLVRSRRSRDLDGRVDDDDIVQSAFKSFFRRVDSGAYDVPAGEELWKLFLVITLNKLRAQGVFHRAAKRDVRQTAADEGALEYAALDSDGSACTLLRLSVDEALDRLDPEEKQAVTLRMEEYSVAEIALRTGRSKRSVERILQEARKRLAQLLEDY